MNEEQNPLEKVFSTARTKDWKYCIWKGSAKLSEVLEAHEDLDLLVDVADIHAIIAHLGEHRFFEVTKPKCRSDIGARDFYCLNSSGHIYHVHLHTKVIFGNALARNYHLPIEHDVLAKRQWNASYGVWCAAPEHDQFLFLCRHLVRQNLTRSNSFLPEFKKVQDFHADHSLDPDLVPDIVPSVRAGLLASQISAGTISELAKSIKMELKPFRLKAQFLPKLLAFISLAWIAVMRRIGFRETGVSVITSGGLMVAFTGIDGSGKSSALARFKKRFSNRIGIVTITMGSGQSGAGVIRQILFYLVGSKAKFNGHVSLRRESRNGNKPKRFPWYYQLWLIICLWEKRTELRRGLNGVRRGKIVLVDRWLQTQCKDGIDAPRTLNMIVDTWLSKYLLNLEADIFRVSNALRPDLLFILDVSAKNSTIRKPDDLSLEKAHEAREKLLSVHWNALKIISIDANMPIEIVDMHVVSSINKAILGL